MHSNLSGLSANTYTVTLTDAQGCKDTGAYYVAPAAVTLTSLITVTPSSNVNTGGNPYKIYLGYGAQSAVFKDIATGASSFSYVWSPSSHLSNAYSQTPTFTPTAAGTYTYSCTATHNGNSVTSTVTMTVVDAVDHSHSGKICITHSSSCGGSSHTQSLSSCNVATYLCKNHNDHLGCAGSGSRESYTAPTGVNFGQTVVPNELLATIAPNPANDAIHIELDNKLESANVIVYDLTGKVMETIQNQDAASGITVGSNLVGGVYIVEIQQGSQSKKVKVVKM